MTAKRIALFGLLTAIALVLSYLDRIVSLDFIAPGVRLGLGNTVLLYGLYMMGKRDAWLLMALKVTLASLLFGFTHLPYSLAGGILSLCAMTLAFRFRFSVVTVSVMGGVTHNVGQIAVAALMTSTRLIFVYLPVLMLFGAIMGLGTGLTAKYAMRALANTDKELKSRVSGTDILREGDNQKKPL